MARRKLRVFLPRNLGRELRVVQEVELIYSANYISDMTADNSNTYDHKILSYLAVLCGHKVFPFDTSNPLFRRSFIFRKSKYSHFWPVFIIPSTSWDTTRVRHALEMYDNPKYNPFTRITQNILKILSFVRNSRCLINDLLVMTS